MNNAVFGKMMENIRNHKNIKLVMTEDKFTKLVMKLNFKSSVLFGENLMGFKMGKVKVVMNKPVYLGQVILDLLKLVMYEFHYDYMRRKYDSHNLKLCYMDTDYLVYQIHTNDFYADITSEVPDRFDTSASRSDRPLPTGLSKKVIGSMKDEMGGNIMEEFVSLRPKLYSYRVGSKEHKKCKGIEKNVVKKTLTFEDYKNCLFNKTNVLRSQLLFRSYKHDVHMIEVNKLALSSSDDDKRIIQPDGISTRAIISPY